MQQVLPFYLRVDQLGKGFVRHANSTAAQQHIDVGATASYKYLLDYPTHGVSRFKFLALLGSVVLRAPSLDETVAGEGAEYWEQLFVPWVHYVPVSATLRDVNSVMARLRSDPSLTESIALNGTRLAFELFAPQVVEEYGAVVLEKLFSNL